MPRDLIDLMESATRAAPPEPYAAADITRLAARRQRRRTTGIAAAVSLAVVVAAGGLGYGLTRDHDTAPQPAKGLKYHQTVDFSQVVPASSLPGYHLEPWTIPSVQTLPDGSRIPTYAAVDSIGRLLVVDAPGGDQLLGPFRTRLYDAPADAAQPLQAPPSPGSIRGVPITWVPRFYGHDQLLWRAPTDQFHITDLGGGHDQLFSTRFRAGSRTLRADPGDVTDGSVWIERPGRAVARGTIRLSSVYRAPLAGQATQVGDDAIVMAVGDGMAGWLATKGRLFVQSATDAKARRVDVPLDRGCRLLPAGLQGLGALAVSSSAVAVLERCGSGGKSTRQVLVFDLSGRRLATVTGGDPFDLAISGDTVLFEGDELVLRYDLVTGTLAQLGEPGPGPAPPAGAGSYVLWYDQAGGHVADITH